MLCNGCKAHKMTKKRIIFIINPISGTGGKEVVSSLIERHIDRDKYDYELRYTEYAGHANEMARQFKNEGVDVVVAVGGDGTVNEVARGIVKAVSLQHSACSGTQTALGIIPMGSGNGFARHLNIPMRPQKALELINRSEPISVDYGLANDKLFVSTCGTGFDALIADHFAGSNKRGFSTYLQNILHDAVSYTPQSYHLVGDGIDVTHKAFLITFANANQWGYEALIAPKASVQDGKMDIMLMSSHAILGSASLALRLFAGSIDDSHFMNTIRAKEVLLEREEAAPFHIDGDPVEMDKNIHIRIVADGLKVLVEKRF